MEHKREKGPTVYLSSYWKFHISLSLSERSCSYFFDGEILIGVSVMVSLSDKIIQKLYKITSSISQKFYPHTKEFVFIWKVTLNYYRAIVRSGLEARPYGSRYTGQ